MKHFKMILFLCGIIEVTAFSCKKNETSNSMDDEFIVLDQVPAKVVKVLKSVDENNQPKTFNWALSTNKDYLDSSSSPVDSTILAPIDFPEEFKIPNQKILVSGKKYVKKNHALTSPDDRVGFGYVFEITEIKKTN
jgi:hypothetical protein